MSFHPRYFLLAVLARSTLISARILSRLPVTLLADSRFHLLLTKLLLRDAHKMVHDSSRIHRFLVGSSSVPVSRYDSPMQDTGVPVPRNNQMHARKRTTKTEHNQNMYWVRNYNQRGLSMSFGPFLCSGSPTRAFLISRGSPRSSQRPRQTSVTVAGTVVFTVAD